MKATLQKKRSGATFGGVTRALQLSLAASSYGRILLHSLVALKERHYLWHFQGISREFIRQ